MPNYGPSAGARSFASHDSPAKRQRTSVDLTHHYGPEREPAFDPRAYYGSYGDRHRAAMGFGSSYGSAPPLPPPPPPHQQQHQQPHRPPYGQSPYSYPPLQPGHGGYPEYSSRAPPSLMAPAPYHPSGPHHAHTPSEPSPFRHQISLERSPVTASPHGPSHTESGPASRPYPLQPPRDPSTSAPPAAHQSFPTSSSLAQVLSGQSSFGSGPRPRSGSGSGSGEGSTSAVGAGVGAGPGLTSPTGNAPLPNSSMLPPPSAILRGEPPQVHLAPLRRTVSSSPPSPPPAASNYNTVDPSTTNQSNQGNQGITSRRQSDAHRPSDVHWQSDAHRQSDAHWQSDAHRQSDVHWQSDAHRDHRDHRDRRSRSDSVTVRPSDDSTPGDDGRAAT